MSNSADHNEDHLYPLGRDGDWLEPERWEHNLSVLRERDDGIVALNALRDVFTPTWSAKQRVGEAFHPVIGDFVTLGGRHLLLELGFMLADMPRTRHLRDRLLSPGEYVGTRAELRAGLHLRAAGAELEWQPLKRTRGPDWLASWPGSALAVEVKCPTEGTRVSQADRVRLDFFHEFSRLLHDPPLAVDAGIWLDIYPTTEILEVKTPLGATDTDEVRAIARAGADAVRSNLPCPIVNGRFSAGRAGEFTVKQGLSGKPRVQFGMVGPNRDSEHAGSRVFATIQKAANQLDSLPDVPGLVLLDSHQDFGLFNSVRDIQQMLRAEPWAARLAGVAISSSSTVADSVAGGLRVDTTVTIVPGARARALVDTLLTGLRVCDKNHFHVDPLLRPSARCESFW